MPRRKPEVWLGAGAATLALAVGLTCGDNGDNLTIPGDWVIDAVAIAEAGKFVDVYGDIIVKNGGSLTLSGVTLTLHQTRDLEHGIRLEGKAALTATARRMLHVESCGCWLLSFSSQRV